MKTKTTDRRLSNSPKEPVLTGKTIHEKYRLISVIGRDSFGVLYRAEEKPKKNPVAIKVLKKGMFLVSDTILEIDHPNVGRIHKVLKDKDGTTSVIMEPPKGRSIRATIKSKKKLPPDQAVAATSQILSALHAVHFANVAVGNLMLSNIYLSKDPLGDLAVTLLNVGIQDRRSLPNKPFNYAPEQILGGTEIDKRADIWTVGVLLFEMIFGFRPFDGLNQDEIAGKILLMDPPYPQTEDKVLSTLLSILERALQKEPEKRYQNVTTMIGDLLPIQETLDESIGESTTDAIKTATKVTLPKKPLGTARTKTSLSSKKVAKPKSSAKQPTKTLLSMQKKSPKGVKPIKPKQGPRPVTESKDSIPPLAIPVDTKGDSETSIEIAFALPPPNLSDKASKENSEGTSPRALPVTRDSKKKSPTGSKIKTKVESKRKDKANAREKNVHVVVMPSKSTPKAKPQTDLMVNMKVAELDARSGPKHTSISSIPARISDSDIIEYSPSITKTEEPVEPAEQVEPLVSSKPFVLLKMQDGMAWVSTHQKQVYRIGGSAALLLVIVVFIFLFTGNEDTLSDRPESQASMLSTSAVSSAAKPEPESKPKPEPTPEPSPEAQPKEPSRPEEITIAILGLPSGAHVTVDEKVLTSPFVVFASDDPIDIKVEAEGYESVTRMIVPDMDRTLTVSMDRTDALQSDEKKPSSKGHKRRRRERRNKRNKKEIDYIMEKSYGNLASNPFGK